MEVPDITWNRDDCRLGDPGAGGAADTMFSPGTRTSGLRKALEGQARSPVRERDYDRSMSAVHRNIEEDLGGDVAGLVCDIDMTGYGHGRI